MTSLRLVDAAVLACVASALMAGCSSEGKPEAEPTIEELITKLCDEEALVECATSQTKQRCLDEMRERQGYAAQEGCEAELRAWLACAVDGAVTCSGYDGESFPHTADACNDLNDAFFYCYTLLPANCAVGAGVPGYTDSACTVKCPTFSSLCHGPDGGPYACACDSGPRAGTSFESSDCGGIGMIWATGHACN